MGGNTRAGLTVRQKEAMRRFDAGSLLLDWGDTSSTLPPEWESPTGKRVRAGVSHATLEALEERGLIAWEESTRPVEGVERRVRYYRMSDAEADRRSMYQCLSCGRPLRPTDECVPCE